MAEDPSYRLKETWESSPHIAVYEPCLDPILNNREHQIFDHIKELLIMRLNIIVVIYFLKVTALENEIILNMGLKNNVVVEGSVW